MCGRGDAWQGGHAPQQIIRDTVNEQVVCILLECILVLWYFPCRLSFSLCLPLSVGVNRPLMCILSFLRCKTILTVKTYRTDCQVEVAQYSKKYQLERRVCVYWGGGVIWVHPKDTHRSSYVFPHLPSSTGQPRPPAPLQLSNDKIYSEIPFVLFKLQKWTTYKVPFTVVSIAKR